MIVESIGYKRAPIRKDSSRRPTGRLLRRLALGLGLVALAGCSADQLSTEAMYHDGIVQRKAVSAPFDPRKPERICAGSGKSASALQGYHPGSSYRVGPGDELRFNIFGEEGMRDFTARVDGAGYVQLPIIELVQVRGKTTRAIQKQLKEAYLVHFEAPWVTVELAHAESKPLFFLGEFKGDRVAHMEHPHTLLEGLALGGGLGEDAYLPGARLIRDNASCIVDVHGLLKEGRFEHNIYLRAHDVLFAPRKEDMQIYVLGAVGKAQAVPFGATGRTVLGALSMAQGPQAKALLSEVRVIRSTSASEGELLVIDVARMLKGEALDYPLEPGDVLYVPQRSYATWNDALEAILPSLETIGGVLTPVAMIKAL